MAAENLYGKGETSDDVQRKGAAGNSADTKQKQGETKPASDPLVARYWREIERYERAVGDWYTEGDEIVDVYLDANRPMSSSTRKFALLWANIETLKPAVYTKVPSLQCSRRYKDKDVIARTAAELIERSTNTTFDLGRVDETFRMVRDDRLLPGRGQGWVRYEADIERRESTAQDGKGNDIVDVREKLKSERVVVDHVPWRDFGHNVARTWTGDVWLVWRAVYKTRDEVEDRFGAEKASLLTYNQKAPGIGAGSAKDDPEDKAKLYECWDKTRSKVSWISKGRQDFLESGDPPINFRDFFPCPEACYATKTSRQMIPVPDYRYYRDQAKEINDLTEKIHNLTKWLMVKGFVPSGPSSIADPLEEAIRDESNVSLFQEVTSMREWSQSGGSKGLIDWLPIDAVIKALQGAIQARAQLIQDVFEITGISDILRGQTDPNETLGAQELKSQTGTRRLKNTKDEIARFTRDIGRLVAEVIAEKFEPQSIAAITGYTYQPGMGGLASPQLPAAAPVGMAGPLPSPAMPGQAPTPPALNGQIIPPGQPLPIMGAPPPFAGPPIGPAMMPGGPSPLPALMAMMGHNGGPMMDNQEHDPELVFDDRHIQLLRDDKMRNFRIDIETDSTTQPDENAEKASANEFMTTVGGVMQQISQMPPVMAPMLDAIAEAFMFLIRRYRAGRGLEEAFENSFNKLKQSVAQQGQQPNPEMMKAQAEAQSRQQEIQAQSQSRQLEIAAETQANQREAATDAQLAVMKHTGAMQAEAQRQQQDAALAVRQQNIDANLKMRDIHARSAAAQARDRMNNVLRLAKPTGQRNAG